jgi:ribonucleoside-diphosphate reductase alpha chain
VHFLDNVIDANHYILPEIESMTKSNRKIGVGLMGFADCLIKLNIPYDSKDALAFADRVMGYIQKETRNESRRLGASRGSFPNIEGSIFRDTGPMRNATVTSIAPTGTISTIAGVSSGIEPLFSVGYLRSALDTTMLMINPLFEEIAKRRDFYSSALLARITHTGSIKNIRDIPADVRRLFPVAHDITPELHVQMQAVFQKHVDNAVSKTINLPEHATLNDMRNVFLLAHRLGCKGITVYRYGSKRRQAFTLGDIEPYDTCATGVCNL